MSRRAALVASLLALPAQASSVLVVAENDLARDAASDVMETFGQAKVKPVGARLARLIKPAKAPRKPEATATTEARESPEPKPVVSASSTPPTPPQPPPDAPAEVTLTPSPSGPEAAVVTPMPVRSDGLKVAAWTVTGLGAAAAGAAATFAALGLSARAQLEREDGGVSPWSRSQANALAARANLSFSVALGTAIGAGVLAVLSAILWSQVP